MKIIIADNYMALSKIAADDLIAAIGNKKEPLVCTASGDSPTGLYRQLVEMVKNKKLDVRTWNFVGLDEWLGLNGGDEGSCRFHLDNQLFKPLHISPDRIGFVDGRAENALKECELTEKYIQKMGGMDVAIVGLGMNGHIGMNEPGTSIHQRTHLSQLDPLTVQVGQKYFQKTQALNGGLTLGLQTLMEARSIMLLVSGSKKAAIVQKVLEEPITEMVPGSLFRNHPNFAVYLDKNAATLLRKS